jgi:hypothetical protein
LNDPDLTRPAAIIFSNPLPLPGVTTSQIEAEFAPTICQSVDIRAEGGRSKRLGVVLAKFLSGSHLPHGRRISTDRSQPRAVLAERD